MDCLLTNKGEKITKLENELQKKPDDKITGDKITGTLENFSIDLFPSMSKFRF